MFRVSVCTVSEDRTRNLNIYFDLAFLPLSPPNIENNVNEHICAHPLDQSFDVRAVFSIVYTPNDIEMGRHVRVVVLIVE